MTDFTYKNAKLYFGWGIETINLLYLNTYFCYNATAKKYHYITLIQKTKKFGIALAIRT